MFSDKDRSDLMNLVKIMVDYNVTYRQERKADGRYAFVFEPSVSFKNLIKIL